MKKRFNQAEVKRKFPLKILPFSHRTRKAKQRPWTESKLGTRLQWRELNTGKDTVPHRGGHSKAFPVRAIDELPRARDNGSEETKEKTKKRRPTLGEAGGRREKNRRRRERGEKKKRRNNAAAASRLQSDANQTRTHGMEV